MVQELKQKKEHIPWLEEQLTVKKKELEATSAKYQETLQKYHQKNEEAEHLKSELKVLFHPLITFWALYRRLKVNLDNQSPLKNK